MPFLRAILREGEIKEEKKIREWIKTSSPSLDFSSCSKYDKNGQFLISPVPTKIIGHSTMGNANKKKGACYECFIGQCYEKEGYMVTYNGIEKNAYDDGIDLVCRNNRHTILVQCKDYSNTSSLSIKDIYQFYGACCHYVIKNNIRNIVLKSFFISRVVCNNRIYKAVEDLGIMLYEGYKTPENS